MNTPPRLNSPTSQHEALSIPDKQSTSAQIRLLTLIDEFQRALPSQRPGADQMAEIIAKALDESPRVAMQDMTGMLSEDLGISPRMVSKVARSLGFQVVAVRAGQKVFKTLQRGNPMQRPAKGRGSFSCRALGELTG